MIETTTAATLRLDRLRRQRRIRLRRSMGHRATGSENGEFVLNFGVTPVNGVTATYSACVSAPTPRPSSPTALPRTAGGRCPVTITLAPDFDWGGTPDSYATDATDGAGARPSHV
ncbi:MAG: hypothetical protein R3A10_00365 [Caldilineaceae bacterium]